MELRSNGALHRIGGGGPAAGRDRVGDVVIHIGQRPGGVAGEDRRAEVVAGKAVRVVKPPHHTGAGRFGDAAAADVPRGGPLGDQACSGVAWHAVPGIHKPLGVGAEPVAPGFAPPGLVSVMPGEGGEAHRFVHRRAMEMAVDFAIKTPRPPGVSAVGVDMIGNCALGKGVWADNCVIPELLHRHQIHGPLHFVGRDQVSSPALELIEEVAGKDAARSIKRSGRIDIRLRRHALVGDKRPGVAKNVPRPRVHRGCQRWPDGHAQDRLAIAIGAVAICVRPEWF